MAARIQKARLPREAPGIPDVEFEWFFDSCDEVAGDMFNFVQLDDHRLGIYILDVSGHGIPAALLSMSLSRSLTAAPDGSGALVKTNGAGLEVSSPAHVAAVMNERYPMNLETNQYFTMIYGILDTATRVFTFVRAGHPPPVLVRSNGEARELDDVCGPAIGILPTVEFEEMSVELEPGDRIILFTDGVDESTNRSGEEFGIGRVITALARIRGGTVSDNVRVLRESIIDFSQGLDQHDDITIVGFGVKEPVTALAPVP
jgi:sigma-B regulation protein RsbU (phosphoserine phosphatase)